VDRFRFDAGHGIPRPHFDGTEADDIPEPDYRWWVAAAVVCFLIHLALFAALVIYCGSY